RHTPCTASSLYSARTHLDLPSLPTRRSSDLPGGDECDRCRRRRSGLEGHPERPWDHICDRRGDRSNWLCQDRRRVGSVGRRRPRSEEHTSELQSLTNLVCRLLLEKKNDNSDL